MQMEIQIWCWACEGMVVMDLVVVFDLCKTILVVSAYRNRGCCAGAVECYGWVCLIEVWAMLGRGEHGVALMLVRGIAIDPEMPPPDAM